MADVLIKRIYEPFEKSDGFRVLLDRLWPRGVKKEDAKTDLWLKEIAPSSALRKWFNHDAEKWNEFIKKYRDELKQSAAMDELKKLVKLHATVTLLYAAHDTQHNNAVVLQRLLHSK
ncbi:MAG: DUF488 domain-containing protein [Ginsengibacter sp.]